MNIEELLNLEEKEFVSELQKGRTTLLPDIKKIKKQLDPKGHDVFDKAKRPDKIVKIKEKINDIISERTVIEPVARIAVSLQKLIIKRSVAFLFGNPVELIANTENDTQLKILNAIKKIGDEVKINSHNRKIARELFSCTEVAELWYPIPLKDNESPRYGIDARSKLRVRVLSPLLGDKLYPYFDEYGDMIAFSRQYEITSGEEKKVYLETYTDDYIFKYDITDNDNPISLDDFPKVNPIKKIPIVYAKKEITDHQDVQELIDRLEKLLSNFADTNDYHASPKIFVKGKLLGFSKKGESGGILQGDVNTEAKYLSWQNAPESVKLEIDTLLRMIYTISQTPDISFEGVKGLGSAVSGKALKMMFLDAHLKVADHLEIFDEYLQRRVSILKSFITLFNISLGSEVSDLDVECEVTPFMVDDYLDKLDFVMTATGNKPILSQRTGVKLAGLVDNSDEEYENIKKEETIGLLEATE